MTTTISRTKAQRLTVVYQIGAAGCVLGAIALGVFGLPESKAAANLDQVADATANPPVQGGIEQGASQPSTTKQSKPTRVDASSIAARLALLDNAPELPETQEVQTPIEQPIEQQQTEPGTLAKRVRYTGYIEDADSPLAFIRIDGVQRIVPEGGIAQAGSIALDDLTLKGVRPKFILVTDGQVEERIQLSTRNGASITMSGGGEVEVARIPQTEAEVVLTPEEIAELDALPARQRAMQERILRRKKMGKPIGSVKNDPQGSFRANMSDRAGTVRRQSPDRPDEE